VTKVLIAGTDYGLQNIGDDAILAAMIKQLRTIDDLDITVATKHAEKMSSWLNVKTLERSGKSNLLKVYKAVFSTDVLIVGGACVISDYQKNLKGLISGYPGFGLTLIALARILRKPVMVYGIGVEDIPSKFKRFIIKKVYNSVDVITLRDQGSLELLNNIFNVTRPKLFVTADPVLGMTYPNDDFVNEINPPILFDNDKKPLVGISFAYGVDTRAELIDFMAKLADHVVNKFDANVLFIPMNIIPQHDLAGLNHVLDQMEFKSNVRMLSLPYSYAEVISLVSKMDMVISSRMHLLIFSSVTNTPVIGISRVPKTDQFLMNFGLKSVVSTDSLNFDESKDAIDAAWRNRHEIKLSLENSRETMYKRAWDNVKFFKEYILLKNKF